MENKNPSPEFTDAVINLIDDRIDKASQQAAPVPEVDAQAVAVALDPKEGDTYTFGGKTFSLGYLSVDGQNTLDKLLKPWMSASAGMSPADQLEALSESIPKAAALILSEQDPDATEAWVGKLKGKGIRERLFELVMAQVGLDEVGKFYATLSYTVAALRRAAGAV